METVREAKRATVDDLYQTPGKAELVNGEIVLMSPTGFELGTASMRVFRVDLYWPPRVHLNTIRFACISYCFGSRPKMTLRNSIKRS